MHRLPQTCLAPRKSSKIGVGTCSAGVARKRWTFTGISVYNRRKRPLTNSAKNAANAATTSVLESNMGLPLVSKQIDWETKIESMQVEGQDIPNLVMAERDNAKLSRTT